MGEGGACKMLQTYHHDALDLQLVSTLAAADSHTMQHQMIDGLLQLMIADLQ